MKRVRPGAWTRGIKITETNSETTASGMINLE